MKDLSRHQCSHIAGGDPGMVLAGGGAFGGGGSSFGSGGINFGGSVGSGFESAVGGGGFEPWEGSGGFESSAVTGPWSLDAIGIEGGAMAVVTISGTPVDVPVFDIEPSIALYGPGEAPWEGQYLGQWQEPAPPSYAHTAFDGALIANTGRLAGTAAALFIEGAITGAGYGAATANPIGVLGGIVIGTLVAAGTYYLLQNDHETGAFVAIP